MKQKALFQLLSPLIEAIFAKLRVCTIGEIETYEKDTHLAKVKDMLSDIDPETETARKLSSFKKVPVFQVGNPRQGLKLIPKVGDPVLVLFTDASNEQWRASSGKVQVAEKSKAKHQESHAIALYFGGAPLQWMEDTMKDIATLIADEPWWIGSLTVNLVEEVHALSDTVINMNTALLGDVDSKGRASSGTLYKIHEALNQAKLAATTVKNRVDTIKG